MPGRGVLPCDSPKLWREEQGQFVGKRQSSSKERGRRVSPRRAVTLSAVWSEPPPERELAPPWHGHFPQFIPEVWEANPHTHISGGTSSRGLSFPRAGLSLQEFTTPAIPGLFPASPAPLSTLPAPHWHPKAFPLLSPVCPPFRTLPAPSMPWGWLAPCRGGGTRLRAGSAEMRKLPELMPKSADCHIQSCSPGSEKIWSR